MTPVISAATQAQRHRLKMWSACSCRRVRHREVRPLVLLLGGAASEEQEGADRGDERPAAHEPGRPPVELRTHERASLFSDHGDSNPSRIRPRICRRVVRAADRARARGLGSTCDTRRARPRRPARGLPRRRILRAAPPGRAGDPAGRAGPGVRRPPPAARAARSARLLLDNARAVVAECLGVRPDEVTFTASGTDAVNRGLLGLVRAQPRRGSRGRASRRRALGGPPAAVASMGRAEDHERVSVDRGPRRPRRPRPAPPRPPRSPWPPSSRPTTRSAPCSP